jgi:hypothetical protein
MASAGPGPDLQMVSSNQWNGVPWDEAAHTRAENEAHALVVATSPTFASSVARALDLEAPLDAPPMLCPLCNDYKPLGGEREHSYQGCRVFFAVCAGCMNKPLCPEDLRGVHKGEAISASDDADEYRRVCKIYNHIPDFRVGTEPSRVGIVLCCGQMVEWMPPLGWQPSTTPTIESLNDRYRRGEIDLETHVAGIKAILSVEAED